MIECSSCGNTATWSTFKKLFGANQWVIMEGSSTQTDCMCVEGARSQGSDCVPCEDGLECFGGGHPLRQLEGYHTNDISVLPPEAYAGIDDGAYSVFKCQTAEWCPNDLVGTCAENRYDLGCSRCLPGTTPSEDGRCVKCKGSHVWPFVLGICCGLLALLVFCGVASRSLGGSQSHTLLLIGVVVGMLVTIVQQMGVLHALSVPWKEPLSSLLMIASLMNFDLEVLQLSCIMNFHPVSNYCTKVSVPFCVLASVCILYVVETKLRQKSLWGQNYILIAALGTLMLVFIIAITNTAVLPFECNSHPNGLKTVRRYPTVVCWEGGMHQTMVSVGSALFAVPFGFLACSFRVAYIYPKKVIAEDTHFLLSFKWLFMRFTPEAYWYGVFLMARNVSFAITPSLPGSVAQIFVLVILILLSLLVVTRILPWRTDIANTLDMCATTALLLLLVMSTFFVSGDEGVEVIGYVCSVSAVAVVVLLIGTVAIFVYLHFKSDKPFEYFICHHKGHAAAQARYLQLNIQQSTRKVCFIDSDHLTNLDTLLDTVKSKVQYLTVFLTRETLKRPWCAGEIATAWMAHKRVVAIWTPSFLPPTDDEVRADTIPSYLAGSVNLFEYGVTHQIIADAYTWLLAEPMRKIEMSSLGLGREDLRLVLRDLLSGAGTSTSAIESTDVTLKPDMLLISTVRRDKEAIATAAILMMKMQRSLQQVCDTGCCLLAEVAGNVAEGNFQAITSARAVVVILCKGSLDSTEQLQDIVDVMGAAERMDVIPVFTPGFDMPSKVFLHEEVPERFGQDIGSIASARIQELFKRIALNFSSHGSDLILEAQTKELLARIPTKQDSSRPSSANKDAISKQSIENMSRVVLIPQRKEADIANMDENVEHFVVTQM